MAGEDGGLTMTIKKSSVVEDDVQDDGIRAGAVVPLPMSARVMAGWQGQGNFSRTNHIMKNLLWLRSKLWLLRCDTNRTRACHLHRNSLHRPCVQHSSEEDLMMLMLLQDVVVDD